MEKSEVMWICNYTILSFLLIKHVKTMIITNLSGPSLQSRRPSIDKSDLRVHCPIITLPWTALEWIDLDLDLLNFSQREHFKVKKHCLQKAWTSNISDLSADSSLTIKEKSLIFSARVLN